MTDVTTLSIPNALIQEAKSLKINSSEEARKAIKEAIEKKKAQNIG